MRPPNSLRGQIRPQIIRFEIYGPNHIVWTILVLRKNLLSLLAATQNPRINALLFWQSCKQSSRLSSPTPQETEPKGATATKGHRRRRRAVLIGGGGGIAANVIHVFHLLAALAAIAAAVSASSASPSSSASQSPFRFRFSDAGGGGFRWKRWETAPTEANNAELLKRLIKRSAFDDLDCRGMYDQVGSFALNDLRQRSPTRGCNE